MKWEPVDYIVAALVLTLVYAAVVGGVGQLLGVELNFNDKQYELRQQTFLAIISVVSMYIGSRLRK